MFGVEPHDQWSEEERAEFEAYAAARLRASKFSAARAGTALLTNIVAIVPFSAGYPLHTHWQQARFLVFTAEALFLWFVIKVGFVWSSWQSSREVRRENERPNLIERQPNYIRAHKHSIKNRAEIQASVFCGCFYCLSIYPPTEIVDWIDDKEAQTADCPRCGIDAVIGSAAGFPITIEFLKAMNKHWFD